MSVSNMPYLSLININVIFRGIMNYLKKYIKLVRLAENRSVIGAIRCVVRDNRPDNMYNDYKIRSIDTHGGNR